MDAAGWSHGQTDPCTTMQLEFGVSAPRLAREQIVVELRAAGLRDAVVVDAELVISEPVANGIEHGRPSASGTIEVSWCVHEDHLRISVCDGGYMKELRPLEFTDDRPRGRGLAMVDVLCSSWSVDDDKGLPITADLDDSDRAVAR